MSFVADSLAKRNQDRLARFIESFKTVEDPSEPINREECQEIKSKVLKNIIKIKIPKSVTRHLEHQTFNKEDS